MSRRRLAASALLAGIGAAIGLVAVLAAGYAAAGPAGLVDVATIAAAGVLIVARGTVRGEEPRPVRTRIKWPVRRRAPAVSTAEFPAYRQIASDLSWGQVSRRQYEHGVRPMLARLAAALGRPEAVAEDLTAPQTPTGPAWTWPRWTAS